VLQPLRDPLVVTGMGVSIPGIEGLARLLEFAESQRVPAESTTTGPPAGPGARFHDRATLFALAAGAHALHHAGLDAAAEDDTGLAVAVSSNLGNLDTVCQAARTLHTGSAADLRPMDLPKASSNVIPSVLAIRFRCRALSLLVCNGASSGLDVLQLACLCLRANRAGRLLVVGVEPRHDVGHRLLAEAFAWSGGARADLHVGEGAAAVVLERLSTALTRGAAVHGQLDGYSCCRGAGAIERSVVSTVSKREVARPLDLWLVSNRRHPQVGAAVAGLLSAAVPVVTPHAVCDVSQPLGELYGALGVLQCVVACLWLARTADRRGGGQALLTAGGWNDGASSFLVSSPQ
jgi:3-oxoacyl-[acyl-carrier-protein] synthase II